ncbi:MAG: RNA methyltransferase [Syntrophales bacterium]|nr:RNA methyltransferase [Syntrophales bacterium]MDD5532480.1 RNA methyltransferase [Syntrophales bacterium]
MSNIFTALIHYPVYNRSGDVVTAAIANADIHDLCRLSRTYAVRRFYIVTPIEKQRELAGRIIGHWMSGYGSTYNPARREALSTAEIKEGLEDVLGDMRSVRPAETRIVATGAGLHENVSSFAELRKIISGSDDNFLILFGTGWGIGKSLIDASDFRLEPVCGPSGYNHLSVRSAAAVVLDRLLGSF